MNEEEKINSKESTLEDKVEGEKKGNKEEEKKDKKKKWIIRIIILIIILLLVLLGLNKCGYCSRPDPGYIIGAGVQEGQLYSNEGTQSGNSNGTSMRVKINGYPVFSDGESAGNLQIENPAENSLYMEVEIKLNYTGEVIYKSGAIPPNHYIEKDKLAIALEKGEYNATAYVNLFNPENQDAQYNSVNFDLIIKIEN